MNFSFGIITSIASSSYLDLLISSIIKQNIEEYEIIIIGNNNLDKEKYKNISIIYLNFNEYIKTAWITKKKNMICEVAKYDNIVLMHDYIILEDGWYEGFKKYGNNFEFCVNQIKNIDGSRYRDYVFFIPEIEPLIGNEALIPYHIEIQQPLIKLLYISGAFYIIKKETALKNPLCENLVWGQGEDVVLSKELTSKGINIKCNPYSSVRLLKHKDKLYFENVMSDAKCKELMSLSNTIINDYDRRQKNHLVHELKNMCEFHKKLFSE